MNNTINVTIPAIELCQEDRLRLDKLIGLLEGLNVAAEAQGLIERKVVEEIIYAPDPAPETPQEAPEPVEQEQTPLETENTQDEPSAPTYTVEDVRAKAMSASTPSSRLIITSVSSQGGMMSGVPPASMTER